MGKEQPIPECLMDRNKVRNNVFIYTDTQIQFELK